MSIFPDFRNTVKPMPNVTLKVHPRELVGNDCHFCGLCGGWIEGTMNESYEDSIGPLCGRRGTVMSCRRCGWELKFVGMYS